MEKSSVKSLSSHRFTHETLAIATKTAVILFATLAVFYQDLAIIFNDALRSETTSHVLVIPFIFVYLIYRKRKMLKAVIPLEEESYPKEAKHLPKIAATLLLATAILLYWYGSYMFNPLEYHMLALPIFASGLTLILFNPQTLKQLVFPIAFLLFLTPPPTEILYAVGATLSVISSEASYTVVKALGVPSRISGEYGIPIIEITRPNGTSMSFAVDIACSGVYSLIGFLIFALFIAYIIRSKTWKKLALFSVGFPLIYLLNIIRITSILLIGYHLGEEKALQTFHLLGGWTLIFLGTLLLLVVSEKIFKIQIFAKSTEKCSECSLEIEKKQSFCHTCGRILKPRSNKLSRNDIMKVVAVTVSIALIISIQAPVFAFTQSPASVIITTPSGQQVSTEILPEISEYQLDFIYRDTKFEERAKQDMALLYLYSPIDQGNEPIWVTIEIASTRTSLHAWEACLIRWPIKQGYQPSVTEIELKDIQLVENPPIMGRYFVFQYKATNQTQAVLYWIESATFAENSTSQQKFVKISVIARPDSLENPTSLENQLFVFATAIANYWQPIKTWSHLTLLLSQNGDKLVILTTATLAIISILYIFIMRKKRETNFRTYQKLSEFSKQIVDATHKTAKTGVSTLNNIADAYQNMTGQSLDKGRLLQELSAIEKTGILRSVIANINDKPILVWKTHMTFKQ